MASHDTTRKSANSSTSRQRKAPREKDPFFSIPASTPSTPQPSPEEPESLVSKLILTPLYFLSYIFSLTLVSRRHNSERASAHASPNTSLLAKLSNWWDPEPYQSDETGRWHAPAGELAQGSGGKWYHRKMHRKVAGMELRDAEALREKVGMAIVGAVGFVVVGAVWAVYSWRRW